MDDELGGFRDDPGWVADASALEPIAIPERRRRRRSKDARRALALAIVGVACFGFVLGPLALALGQRARLAMIVERADRAVGDGAGADHADDADDAAVARAAIALGKVGLALHLAVVASIIPWLLFALPLVLASGR